ncbi:exonuclease subunit SbcD [Gayadomonas joobiniege]|uniref:exonuclease subunit SbcD n=1 Tax=Gayadomonas joobiniege TaxID=1234606 RepID=UPI00037CD9DF|nr:exonuclease subunit SbcD [Gayadomonas joobiniege]
MRILHTSDWHLGQNFYNRNRSAEHQALIDWLIKTVRDQQIDLVLVAGDIFDTGAPASYARKMLNQFVVQLSQLNCQLILLAGNHDSVAVLNECQSLYAALNCRLVTTAQASAIQEQIFTLQNAQGEPAAVFCAVPFLRPRDILSASESSHQDLQHAISRHYQALFERAQALSQQVGIASLPIIGSGHLTLLNSKKTNSVRDIYIGSLEALPASVLPDFDYLALGHIHQPQAIGPTGKIRYSGSPLAMSFDEKSSEKSVVIYDTLAADPIHLLAVPEFQPLKQICCSLQQLPAELAALPAHKLPYWLDIEISATDYHAKVQQQVHEIAADYPVEVLLVRRARKAAQLDPAFIQTSSLTELKVTDVFNQRLTEIELDSEQSRALQTRFLQCLEQVNKEPL